MPSSAGIRHTYIEVQGRYFGVWDIGREILAVPLPPWVTAGEATRHSQTSLPSWDKTGKIIELVQLWSRSDDRTKNSLATEGCGYRPMSQALTDLLAWKLGTCVHWLLFKNRLSVCPSIAKHLPENHAQVAHAHHGLLEQGLSPARCHLAPPHLVRDAAQVAMRRSSRTAWVKKAHRAKQVFLTLEQKRLLQQCSSLPLQKRWSLWPLCLFIYTSGKPPQATPTLHGATTV